ncbi:MAG: PIN domain-containing protein [Deltaproteobacteria bacterium]|nr:PIN domain-containing protein [Deltaproteobacteria bacterium]
MNIIVDTSVWSLVLRRRQVNEKDPYVVAFRSHIDRSDGIHLTGNILQELLDGVATDVDFEKLVRLLDPFPLVPLKRDSFIQASKLRSHCRRKGIQASPTDFLIAACCIENGYPLLTSDHDFLRIAKHSDLTLLPIQP